MGGRARGRGAAVYTHSVGTSPALTPGRQHASLEEWSAEWVRTVTKELGGTSGAGAESRGREGAGDLDLGEGKGGAGDGLGDAEGAEEGDHG